MTLYVFDRLNNRYGSITDVSYIVHERAIDRRTELPQITPTDSVRVC